MSPSGEDPHAAQRAPARAPGVGHTCALLEGWACGGLTDRLWSLQDDVAAVEHQQACEDQDEDPQSETCLQGQTPPFSVGGKAACGAECT